MHQKTMSSVPGVRERLNTPARFRRKTVTGMTYSVPNSARLSSTPRASTALDNKWVHRSQGDLSVDMDLQIHPRLRSDFYQDLYKKYPQAFRKRREAREAGRKLFNPHHHVRFKDEIDVSDTRSASSLELRSSHLNREKHLTNWDREVGHFINHRRHTRDCFTSAEPSECSGSVMSVTQKLKLNTQTLNKLLNEESPLRNRFRKENVQYDESGTENEQSLQDYVLEKSRERSRHRKHQRRIIIQRKILKAENENMKGMTSYVDENSQSRRWMSKSASPTRRNQIQYSLPPAGMQRSKSNNHHINVESLITDSDLKIDTLLENMGPNQTFAESPPDSAIDVDTPSVQSPIMSTKGGNSRKSEMVLVELPDLNDKEEERFDSPENELESSPGSSASAHVMRNGLPTYSGDDEEVSAVGKTLTNSNNEHGGDIDTRNDDQCENRLTENGNESEEISRIVEKYSNSNDHNIDASPGLLQVYSAEMGYSDFNNVCNNDHSANARDNNGVNDDVQNENMEVNSECTGAINGDIANNEGDSENVVEDGHHDVNQGTEIITEQGYVTTDRITQMSKDIKTTRDSDVDSGLGYSSACTDTLPPRGRSRQRERTMKSQPVQANHSIVPCKSDVDVDILNEVNLVHLSHDLSLSCDHLTVNGDPAVIHYVPKMPEEKKLAQKYLRVRSPSPFILRNKHQASVLRPKSAPTYAKSENDLRIVDIPLRDNDSSDTTHCLPSSTVTLHNTCHNSNLQQNHLQHNSQKSNINPCHKSNNIGSQFVSMPNLAGTDKPGTISSISNRQRNYSSTSAESSVSPMSESETETAPHTCVPNYKEAIANIETATDGAEMDIPTRNSHQHNHSFEAMDLDSEHVAVLTQSDITKKKGMYKPSMTSPRVKEKKLKIRNILKNKKGTFSPSAGENPDRQNVEEKNVKNRIYAKNRGAPSSNSYENWGKRSDDSNSQLSGRSSETNRTDIADIHSDHFTGVKHGRLTPYDVAKTNSLDTESVGNFITGRNSDTVTARPVVLDGYSNDIDSRSGNTIDEPMRPVSPMKALPPKKPARTKKKNQNPQNELTLPQYKTDNNLLGDSSQPSSHHVPSGNELNQSHGSSQSGYQSTSSEDGRPGRKSLTLQPQDHHIEVIEPHISNLKKNKEMSASKTSLFDKMKKGTLKNFKKSISMDRGIDKAGHSTNGAPQSKGGNSLFPKIKKGPSLKSLTSLFKRKKKRGQFHIEDHDTNSAFGSTLTVHSGKSEPLSKQWASCHTLSTIESPNTHDPIKNQKMSHDSIQPMGKLQKMYPDGSQVIQLVKPENGPIGFFIAQGSAKYGNGIFVSRFSATRPEQCFAGLLGVGDEILEVNGHNVRDQSQDSVYNLISASPIVILKIFPYIARKDV